MKADYPSPKSFIQAVRWMRSAQDLYYKERTNVHLIDAKHWESVVDKWLRAHRDEEGGLYADRPAVQEALDLGGEVKSVTDEDRLSDLAEHG